jgi:hypothetical protein
VKRALLLAALALAGCKPTLYALSTPPPGRTGWLDTKHRTLEVSPGVAIAFACDKWDGGPCKKATATVDDPSIASVVPAHLARLEARMDDTDTSMVPATSFVVVARASGTTTVRVHSDDGDRALTVTVLPGATPVAEAKAPAAAAR